MLPAEVLSLGHTMLAAAFQPANEGSALGGAYIEVALSLRSLYVHMIDHH